MSNAEKHRALSTEALETLNRVFADRAGDQPCNASLNDDPLAAAIALDNASRANFAQLKKKQAEALPGLVYKTCEQPIAQSVDRAEVAAMIDAERLSLLQLLGEWVGEYVAQDRKTANVELADEVRRLSFELTETQKTLSELRQVLAAERGRVLDPDRAPRQRVQ